MGTAIVSGCDTAPVFQPCEHVFDLVTLFVQGFGVTSWSSPVCSWWDASLDLAGVQRIPELVAVIAFVANQDFGIRYRGIDQLRPNMIGELAFTQAEN